MHPGFIPMFYVSGAVLGRLALPRLEQIYRSGYALAVSAASTVPSSRRWATTLTANTKGSMMEQKKIALITGAAQGIGFACAVALLGDGLFVILADVKTEEVKSAATRLGDRADLIVCDMSRPDSIAAMFQAIEAKHGPISVLVNSAGIAIPAPSSIRRRSSSGRSSTSMLWACFWRHNMPHGR